MKYQEIYPQIPERKKETMIVDKVVKIKILL